MFYRACPLTVIMNLKPKDLYKFLYFFPLSIYLLEYLYNIFKKNLLNKNFKILKFYRKLNPEEIEFSLNRLSKR